jgi:hypothetical protein
LNWPDVSTLEELNNLPGWIKQELLDDRNKLILPPYILELQSLIKDGLKTFEGQTFLDWSYSKNFRVTELLHPLEEAHRAAADLWISEYKKY